MIKKAYIKERFMKHFKSTLGPQDDDKEPHPCIAHMYAIHITETMNALQAMAKHQRQLLNLYHAMTHQDSAYSSFAEQQWSKRLTYGLLQGEAKMEKKRVLKTIQKMLNIPEEMSYRERNRICRQEEIWQARHWHMFEVIEAKEQGPKREEELRRFWWVFENDNFTLMYGQEMNALINHKISTEEAERAVRQAQRVEIQEEDLSEEESSEEEGHHKEDIEEDKTNKPNRDP